MWITEWDEKSRDVVATYQRWAKSFNNASRMYETKLDMRKVDKGPVIATELNAGGEVVDVELLRSSGWTELDAYALEVARSAEPGAPLPSFLIEQRKKIRIVAVIAFRFPENGSGRAAPDASVNGIALARFHEKFQRAVVDGFSRIVPPGKGNVSLWIGFRRGAVVTIEADPKEGSPALNEFAVRELRRMAASFPKCPAEEDMVLLPMTF